MDEQNEIVKEKNGFNFGKLYVYLLESDLHTEAKLLWGVMDSFGSESRAGTQAICQRASMVKTTMKKYRGELIAKGWLEMLQKATRTKPYRWILKIPDSAKGSRHDPGVGHGMTQGGSRHDPGVGHGMTPKQEDKQEDKKEETPAKAGSVVLKHVDQDACWHSLSEAWAGRFRGAKLQWPNQMRNFQRVFSEALSVYGHVELTRRFKIMLGDPFARPSLRVFFADLDRWMEPRKDMTQIRQASKENFELQREKNRDTAELAKSLGLTNIMKKV